MVVMTILNEREHMQKESCVLYHAEDEDAAYTLNLLCMHTGCNYWWEYSLDPNLFTLLPQYEDLRLHATEMSPCIRKSHSSHTSNTPGRASITLTTGSQLIRIASHGNI